MSMLSAWWKNVGMKDKLNASLKSELQKQRSRLITILSGYLSAPIATKATDEIIKVFTDLVDQVL